MRYPRHTTPAVFAFRARGGFAVGVEFEPATPFAYARFVVALGFFAVGVEW